MPPFWISNPLNPLSPFHDDDSDDNLTHNNSDNNVPKVSDADNVLDAPLDNDPDEKIETLRDYLLNHNYDSDPMLIGKNDVGADFSDAIYTFDSSLKVKADKHSDYIISEKLVQKPIKKI